MHRPVLVLGLLLMVAATSVRARVLKTTVVPANCAKKNALYTCEDETELTELVCGNTPNEADNEDDSVCLTPDSVFCRIDAEDLPVDGKMTCGGHTITVKVDTPADAPVQLTLTSTGTFVDFVGAKGGPAYCRLSPTVEAYKSLSSTCQPR